MSPFDMQFSQTIHNERIREATASGRSGHTGFWSVGTLPGFGAALTSLAKKLGVQPQSKPVASTSRLS
jgi:hypothetical protein